jgi:hypothetical protein
MMIVLEEERGQGRLPDLETFPLVCYFSLESFSTKNQNSIPISAALQINVGLHSIEGVYKAAR